MAISGIGAGNAKNEPYPILPVYKQRDNSVTEPADFGSFVPDVVIIGLGTNDVGRQNPAQDFVNSAVELIRFIRAQHPDCVIIWTYGVMGDPAYGENPRRAVEIVTEEGMKNVYYMPATPAEGGGWDWPPTRWWRIMSAWRRSCPPSSPTRLAGKKSGRSKLKPKKGGGFRNLNGIPLPFWRNFCYKGQK